MSTRRKQPDKLALPVAKRNPKHPTKYTVNESRTAVATNEAHANQVSKKPAIETIEISSSSGSSHYDDSEEDGEDENTQENPNEGNVSREPNTRGVADDQDEEMAGAAPDDTTHLETRDATNATTQPQQEDGDDSDNAPTFGDLVRTNDPIDVPPTLLGQGATALTSNAAEGKQQLATPNLSSLGTVLAQALRTDDNDLLESCLRVSDTATVNNTVQRLDPLLAAAFITKLASRLHRRPGRAGTLVVWVQWTLVCHGGTLARDQDVKRRLTELQRVLKERAEGLPSLLMLKGKLDMLENQLRNRRFAVQKHKLGNEQDPNEEEEDVVYVEDEAQDLDDAAYAGDENMPLVNGIGSDVSDDEDEDDEEEEEEEESGAEEVYDDDDVDHEEEDSEEDDDSDMPEAAAPPPAKIQKTGGAFSKRK